MLLVPRGYLSTFMKLGVVALLGVGVILMAPTIEMPRVTIFATEADRLFPARFFPFSLSPLPAEPYQAFTRWSLPGRRRR